MLFFIVLIVLVVWVVSIYNRLIRLVNTAKEAWADIDVQLKRRYDLIPNLVETVKGYATHESAVFEKVTQARAAAMGVSGSAGTGSLAEKSQVEATLAGALKSVFAIAEAYPELKANQNFASLQANLTDTENKVQSSRRFYNGTVRDLNTSIEVFPGNIIAGMFHFSKMEFFQLDDTTQREPVAVKF